MERLLRAPGVTFVVIGVCYGVLPFFVAVYSTVVFSRLLQNLDPWMAQTMPGMCEGMLHVAHDLCDTWSRSMLLLGPLLMIVVSWIFEPLLIQTFRTASTRRSCAVVTMTGGLAAVILLSALSHAVGLTAAAGSIGAARAFHNCVPYVPFPSLPTLDEKPHLGGIIFIWFILLARLPCVLFIRTKNTSDPIAPLMPSKLSATDNDEDDEDDDVVISAMQPRLSKTVTFQEIQPAPESNV
jgi:hypothetical protein